MWRLIWIWVHESYSIQGIFRRIGLKYFPGYMVYSPDFCKRLFQVKYIPSYGTIQWDLEKYHNAGYPLSQSDDKFLGKAWQFQYLFGLKHLDPDIGLVYKANTDTVKRKFPGNSVNRDEGDGRASKLSGYSVHRDEGHGNAPVGLCGVNLDRLHPCLQWPIRPYSGGVFHWHSVRMTMLKSHLCLTPKFYRLMAGLPLVSRRYSVRATTLVMILTTFMGISILHGGCIALSDYRSLRRS